MKKAYSKPEIVFENFSLTTHIAGDCETIANRAAEGTCGYQLRGEHVLFSNTLTDCTSTANVGVAPDGTPILNDTICYHNPLDPGNLFNS